MSLIVLYIKVTWPLKKLHFLRRFVLLIEEIQFLS